MLDSRENYGLPFLFPLQKTTPNREEPHQSMFTPWTQPMAVSSPVTTLCHTPLVPNSLARPPHTWTKDEVRIWLEWCAAEFSIEPVSQDKFDMNGKALGLLTREDFKERDTSSGDLLFNALQRLMKKHDGVNPFPSFHSPVVSSPSMTSLSHHGTPCHPLKTPVHLSDPRQNGIILFTGSPTNNNSQPTFNNIEKNHTSYVPIRPVPVTSYPPSIPQSQNLSPKVLVPGNSMLSPAPTTDTDSGAETEALHEGDDEMTYCDNVSPNNHHSPEVGMTTHDRISENTMPHIKKSDGDCRLLWEFIHQLLQESKYSEFVSWERKDELIFRIVNPTGLAELWGYQKNRTNMTYEKLSRALRYYYKMNIIKKVSGKRLTYQFLQHPRNIKKGQRGARPHSARFIKQDLPPVPPSHPITEQHPLSPPIAAQHPEDSQPTSHSPVHHPITATYDSYDRQPDLQLIDGRLRPTPEDSENRFDSEEDHTVPYIKPEVPVQEEPEDLSMKPSAKRRSSEFSDYVDHSRRSPGDLDCGDIRLERIKMETS